MIHWLVLTFAISAIAGLLMLPYILQWSIRTGFTDNPGGRKVHRKPVPVIGGIVIFLSVCVAVLVSPPLRNFLQFHAALTIGMVVLVVTGILDDRLNLPARLRLFIQLSCAFAIAYSGIRIESMHGIAGVYQLPVFLQYTMTILIITGITNAFNLIDGIDGLAGMLALANMIIMCGIAILLQQFDWMLLLLPVIAGIIVFLKYNLYPAKIFMGDGGSLFLGFLMAITSVYFFQHLMQAPVYISPSAIAVIITGCLAIPVVDTLRVFIQRMRRGKSPFSADKTHLHHKLIRHFLVHGSAGKKLLAFHMLLVVLSAAAHMVLATTVVVIMQVLAVLCYTLFLDFSHNYSRWYRFIKRYEGAN